MTRSPVKVTLRRTADLGLTLKQHVLQEARRLNAAARPDPRVQAYLDAHPVRKLHLGCGPNRLESWLDTDLEPEDGVVFLDVAERFPFPDQAFDYVYAEHIIEHVPNEAGLEMLRECHRVLRSGGRIRLATPDLRLVTDLLEATPGSAAQAYVDWASAKFYPHLDPSPSLVVNMWFREFGHQFMYDEDTLTAALRRAGFVDPVLPEYGKSDDPQMEGLETHGEVAGNEEMVRFETMLIEARKP